MSNLNMDVLDLLADEDFNLEKEVLAMDQSKEFGYVPNMNCPVPECNVPGAFPSRAKYHDIGRRDTSLKTKSGVVHSNH